MKVTGQQNSLKDQLAQAVKSAMQLVPGASGASAESEALLKEFADVMDKIAAKLKESSPKGKLIGFNDFGIGELEHLVALAPKVEKVEPQPVPNSDKKVDEQPVKEDVAAAPDATKSEGKVEVKCEKPHDQKQKDKAEVEAAKPQTEKQAEPSEKQVKELIKQGVELLSAKPAKEVVGEKTQEVAPQVETPVLEEAVVSTDIKGQLKAQVKVADVSQKVEQGKAAVVKPHSDIAPVIGKEVAIKQDVPVDAAPEAAAPKLDLNSVQLQAQTKLAAVFSAEISRIRADVSVVRASAEHDLSITSAVKQSSEAASKINNQVNAASARSNSFNSDAGFAKASENLARADAPRAARPLTQAAASRTMEKVEHALKEAAKSRDGKTISLRLDPPELGSVKIDISMRDGNLHARLVAESPAVNQLLRDKAHELQTTLRKLGLQVDSVSVSVSNNEERSAGEQHSFSQRNAERGSDYSGSFGTMLSGPQGRETVSAVEDHWIA